MKKLVLNFVTFSLLIRAFGFWELEGPFGQQSIEYVTLYHEFTELSHRTRAIICTQMLRNNTNSLIKPIKCVDAHAWKSYDYLCMYNKQTGYSIGYVKLEKSVSSSESIKFFLGNNNKDFSRSKLTPSWSDPFGFYFIKEDPNLDLDGSPNPIIGTELYLRLKRELDQLFYKVGRIYLPNIPSAKERCFDLNQGLKGQISRRSKGLNKIRTTLGLVIINKNEEVKVDVQCGSLFYNAINRFLKFISCGHSRKIKRHRPLLDFQDLLIKYFNKEAKQQDFVQDLMDSLDNNGGLSARKLDALKFASRVGEGEIKKLKNSKILAVYGLTKNDSGQDAIIWGLAEDTTSPEKRRFHWITDLEDDVSVLLRQ